MTRNINKTLIVFNDEELLFYRWVDRIVNQLAVAFEGATLWLNVKYWTDDSLKEYQVDPIPFLDLLIQALYSKYTISYSEKEDEYEFVPLEGEQKINKFTQVVFRNLKIYDHILMLITSNLKLLKNIRLGTIVDADKDYED